MGKKKKFHYSRFLIVKPLGPYVGRLTLFQLKRFFGKWYISGSWTMAEVTSILTGPSL